MKFLYVDESGEQSHTDYFVMAGVMVDAVKLRKRTEDLDKLWDDLFAQHPASPKEIKTTRMINGKGDWSKVDPDIRKKFVSEVIALATENGGKVFALPIDFNKHNNELDHDSFGPPYPKDKWTYAAMFLSSLVQKKMQKVKGKKGLTVVIVDNNKKGMPSLTQGLHECPDWFDGLYTLPKTRKTKGWTSRKDADRFDHIVNNAFAIVSEHSTFVQVADVISYVYRRHFEIAAQGEAYMGEKDLYDGWIATLEGSRQKLGRTQPCDALNYYNAIVPDGWTL